MIFLIATSMIDLYLKLAIIAQAIFVVLALVFAILAIVGLLKRR